VSDPNKQFMPPPVPPSGGPSGPGSGPPVPYEQSLPAQYGPPGRVRSIGVSILLAIVTLGIYTYVWTWRTQEEMKRHTGTGVGGAIGFVIYLVVSPVTYFLVPHEVKQMLQRSGRTSRVSGVTGFWILLPLFGPLIWFVKVQGQLNDYWRSLGVPG
jgi:hypothetical protein